MCVWHWVTVLGKISHSALCHAPRAIVGIAHPQCLFNNQGCDTKKGMVTHYNYKQLFLRFEVGLCTVHLMGTAVNLHFESHNGNEWVKNGRKQVWQLFFPPFNVIHFFHIFSVPGKCKKNYWGWIRKIWTFKQQIARLRCEQTFHRVSIAMSQHH